MKRTKDPLYRLANDVFMQLDRLARSSRDQLDQQIENLDSACQSISRSCRHRRLARSRGWEVAESQNRQQVLGCLRRLQEYARELTDRQDRLPPALPTMSLLMAELRQLQEEFETVQIGPGRGLISVMTEPIVLGDLDLGPFRIELHLARLIRHRGSASFNCVALEPNSARSNDAVTHPHVRDSSLCAGNAAAGIATALSQGRICDAFLLVAGILRNYNPGSPYVSLEDWTRAHCPDCDCRTPRDGMTCCDHCEREVCESCMSSCDVCGSSLCRSCLDRDDHARWYCCPACRHTCNQCNRTVNADDFDQDTELCPQCLEQQQESESEPQQPLTTDHSSHEQGQESIQSQAVQRS